MPYSAQENYLTTEVLTATPQRLHLMLVEAAIRCCERARRQWADGQGEHACEAMIHAQNIITEVLTRLNHEGDPETSKNLASIYLFVFRSLLEANVQQDLTKLEEAIRVLQTERETWHQVCQRFGSSDAAQSAGKVSLSNGVGTPVAPVASFPQSSDETYTGFSVEA